MGEVSIRECQPADAEAVERLRIAAWQVAYRGMIPDTFLDALPVDAERRRQHIAGRTADDVEHIAEYDGEVAGWLRGGPCRDPDRPQCWQGEIFACYVAPPWWGRGVGGLLMTHAIGALAAAGRTDLTLWVLAANLRARRFYEGHGFRPDGRLQDLDLGAPVTEVRYHRAGVI